MRNVSARQIANLAIEAIKLNTAQISKDGVKVCHISTAYRRWAKVESNEAFGAPVFSTRDDVHDVIEYIFMIHGFIAGADISVMDASKDVDMLTDIVCARLGISVDSEMNDTVRTTALVGFYIEACDRMHAPVDITTSVLYDAAAKVVASAHSDPTLSQRVEYFLDDAPYMRRVPIHDGRLSIAKEMHSRFLSITGLRKSPAQASPVMDSTPVESTADVLDGAMPLSKAMGLSLAITGVCMVFMYWALNAVFY